MRKRAETDAKASSYHLNPDSAFLQDLLEGLRRNEERHGYPSCPCRLASGNLEFDRDIICPCDYRDPDVEEFGYCYCTLYVRKDVFEGKTRVVPIPERRPLQKQTRAYGVAIGPATEKPSKQTATVAKLAPEIERKMWYCKQCGYVCFREDQPYICPICKAKRMMFAELAITLSAQG